MTLASMVEKYNEHKQKFRSLQGESVIINRQMAQLNARTTSLKKELQKIESSLHAMHHELTNAVQTERRKANEVKP